MTGVKKHLGGIARLKVKTDQKWWKRNIGIWVSLGKCLMYTTILLKARHLREIVVITKAKYRLQMLVPKFCTDSQSWSTKHTGWASLGLMVPVHCGSQLQDAEQNMKWVPWSREGSVMPNTPCCVSVWEIPFPTPGWLPTAPAGPCSGIAAAARPQLMTATSLHGVPRCWKKGRN